MSSVACIQGNVRLVGGSSGLEGRVEVCNNNAWALFVMIPGTFLMGMLCVGNLDTVKVGQSE